MAFVAVLFFSLSVNSGYGQFAQKITRNSLYAGFATHGAFYSLNYDRIFSPGKKISKSCSAGFSFLKDAIAMPLGIHFFTGSDASHAEFGLTVVPYIEKYNDLFSGANRSDKKLYIIPGAGYRYQKPAGGFFFKAALAPVIYLDPASDNFWKMDGKVLFGATGAAGFSF
jgi:hypothetical protein